MRTQKILTIVLFGLFVFIVYQSNAQETKNNTSKNTFLIEANTGFSEIGMTGIYAYVVDDMIYYNLGADAGYFIIDDLAIRLGLFYGGGGNNRGRLAYRLGGKYYINSKVPVGLDITGQSIEDYDNNPTWLGIQAGYAFFLSDRIAIEPGARWNQSLNEDWDDSGFFELNIGFTLFF
jgi:hypothetical protein